MAPVTAGGADRAERIVNATGRDIVVASKCEGEDASHSHESLRDAVIGAIPAPNFIKKRAFGESDADRAGAGASTTTQ